MSTISGDGTSSQFLFKNKMSQKKLTEVCNTADEFRSEISAVFTKYFSFIVSVTSFNSSKLRALTVLSKSPLAVSLCCEQSLVKRQTSKEIRTCVT